MSSSRPMFRSRWLPYLLVAPQLIITVIFFIWPAGEALWYSLQSVDPFGFSSQFVGLDNFVTLLARRGSEIAVGSVANVKATLFADCRRREIQSVVQLKVCECQAGG